MSKKKNYLFNITPRWILYSGLPKQLNKKYGPGAGAWAIFHCLIQLDCRYNWDYPDTFDQLFEEIADLTGTTRRTVSKYIEAFEKDKLLIVKRGVRGRKSTFKLTNPINTPKDPKEIHTSDGGLFNQKGKQPILRYAEYGKGLHLIEGEIKGKIGTNKGKDTQNKEKGVPTNNRKREEKRRNNNKRTYRKEKTQPYHKKPGVVALRLNQKHRKPKRVVKEKFSPEDISLITKLADLGIKKKKALDLIAIYGPDMVKKQLDWLPYRKNIKNPAGALIKAVEENWLEPAKYPKKPAARRKLEEIKKRQEIQSTILKSANEDLKKGASEERVKEWLDKLDPEYQKELKESLKKADFWGIAQKLSWVESEKYRRLYRGAKE